MNILQSIFSCKKPKMAKMLHTAVLLCRAVACRKIFLESHITPRTLTYRHSISWHRGFFRKRAIFLLNKPWAQTAVSNNRSFFPRPELIERMGNPVRQTFHTGNGMFSLWFNELRLLVHWITMKTCRIPYENPAVRDSASSLLISDNDNLSRISTLWFCEREQITFISPG